MIEDGFHEKKSIQLQFGSIWKKLLTRCGLMNKLNNINISHKMLHWIKKYLKNRQALVKTNVIRSKTENLQNGVPQGGVLSPTSFPIFINDIQKQISKKVYPSLYADDLALLCTEEELGTAKIRLQTTLNGLSKWASDSGLPVNKTKTTYTVFTLSTKKCNVKLETNGWSLQKNDNPTYLGVTFDTSLTWNKQTEKCLKRGMQRTALIKKMAGSKWGANHNILKKNLPGICETSPGVQHKLLGPNSFQQFSKS